MYNGFVCPSLPAAMPRVLLGREGAMMNRLRAKHWALAAAGLIAGFCTLAPAAAAGVDMYDGEWHYDLTLNIWPPLLKATYNFDLPPLLAARAPGLGGG